MLTGFVGQWAPIAGIVLTILGSMYLLVAEAIEYKRDEDKAKRAYIKAAEERGPGEVTSKLADISIAMGARVRDLLPAKAYTSGVQYHSYPETPGEAGRNDHLDLIRIHSNQLDDTASLARSRSNSRASSIRSVVSRHNSDSPPQILPQPSRRRSTLDVPAPAYLRRGEQSGTLTDEPIQDDTISVVSEVLLQHEHDVTSSSGTGKKRGLSFPAGRGASSTPPIQTPAIVLTPTSMHNRTMSEPH
jgi:hypothetical protein